MEETGTIEQNQTDSKVIELPFTLDGKQVRSWVDQRVRDGVEEVLQAILEEESKALCGASHHERTDDRKDYRNGYRQRKLVNRVDVCDVDCGALSTAGVFG